MILIQNLVYSQVANQPSDLFTCDNANNGGFAEFDLTVNDQQIIGTQNPINFDINYFEYQELAEAGVNPIILPTSYVNSTNPQTIYARITEISTGNYNTTNFIIEVLPLPIISNITPLEACDDSFAPSGDGIAEFDLTSKNVEILNGQNSASFEINYFETQADAEADINQIIQPASYVNTENPQSIFVRLENIESGCFNVDVFELITIDCTDNDDDGVIDSDEDLNSNGNLDDDDTDQDSIANYMDSDDDGDNVNTLNEINITSGSNSNLSYTFIDTDGDIIPNHIDNDDDNDGVLTIDEDYNNNGDPTDDDTDNSGIADYLEANVALSIESFENQNLKMFPNPSNDLVTIKASNQISNISIYNVQGKQVNLEIIKNSVSELNFSVINLENGIYFIKIQNEFKETIMKLIVK
ncbi:T9SS type A sorting domain-containing protein [Flavobacteriaceae bacterium]|nr:T9SS type A sorting domain-containing protein [Flavobacteriaceae bacterium]